MTAPRILLIRSGGIGDSILTLPVALRLREHYPGVELHILGNGNMLAAARLTSLFAGFHSLDDAGFCALFSDSGTTPFLRSFFSRFDQVYCFTAGNGEHIVRVILNSGAHFCRTLDPRPPAGWTAHITRHFLSILGPESAPATLPALEKAASCSQSTRALVIHPGSGGIPKTWPLDRFVTIAERWPGEVVFLLGHAEIERDYAEHIPGCFRICADLPLSEARSLLSTASLYLGNDSGPSHLAALSGTAVIALFGPTDPRVWRPLGARVTVIASPTGSMEGIGGEEVERAVMTAKKAGDRPAFRLLI